MGTIGVIVTTRNRFQFASQCLTSISHQSILPDEIIVVEDIREHQFFSRTGLKKMFAPQVQCIYKVVSSGNGVTSRNTGLLLSHSDICLMVDDDTILASDYLERLRELYKKYPDACCFVGKMLPIKKSIYADFESRMNMYALQSVRTEVKIKTAAYAAISVRRQAIILNSLFINPDIISCQDHDWLLKLNSLGFLLYFSPKLLSFNYFHTTLSEFIKSHIFYAKGNAYIENTYGDFNVQSRFIPKSVILYPVLPLFVCIRSLTLAFSDCHKLKMEKQLCIPAFIHYLCTFIGIYVSPEGRAMLRNNFYDLCRISS